MDVMSPRKPWRQLVSMLATISLALWMTGWVLADARLPLARPVVEAQAAPSNPARIRAGAGKRALRRAWARLMSLLGRLFGQGRETYYA